MPPDFLNSREDAILVWTVLIFGGVMIKSPSLIRSALRAIASFLQPKLLLIFGAAAFYAAGVVLLAERIGLWQTGVLKETIYWFIGGALVLVGNAIVANPDRAYLKRILRKAVSLTIFVELVANFYVLPLGYELALVFLVVALTLLSVVVPHTTGTPPGLSSAIDNALTAIGFFILGTFALNAILDPSGLVTTETARRLLVVPLLTVALVPYLFAVAWSCRREETIVRRRLGLQV